MSSFSTSETRTPTKSSNAVTDFSIASLCSSAKKSSSTTTTTTSSIAGSNNASFMHASNLSSFHYNTKNDKPSNTSSSISTSSSSFLSSNVDLIQAKIEHLERERMELSLQLHTRDEKDRDRKLQVERLENRLKQSEEERSKATTDLLDVKDQLVRMKIEREEVNIELQRLQKEVSSSNRLEAMDVWKKMTTASRELKRVEEELNQSNNERAHLHSENTRIHHEYDTIQQMNEVLKAEVSQLKEALTQLTDVSEQYANLQNDHQMYLEQTSTQLITLQDEIEALRTLVSELRQENEELVQRVNEQDEINFNTSMIIGEGNDVETVVRELKIKLTESEQKRRYLHNLVQELKGNIRVFVRCRPFLPSDGEDAYEAQQSLLLFHEDQTSLTVLPGNASMPSISNIKPHQFAFDHIFPSSSKQEDIYSEVSSLVQSALDGYQICLFSYGQTGSGKTHTMTGSRSGAERGIIPRTIEELLQQIQQLHSMGWALEVSTSIVEIYNEDLRDLLPASLTQPAQSKASHHNNNKAEKKEYKIMRHPHTNKVVVSGLHSHVIPTHDVEEGIETFHQILDLAAMTRTTASTGMNETSSRSHLIVMIDVQGTYTNPNPSAKGANSTITIQGGLRLCDLAGSERLDRTNTLHDATRLKETVNINKSLSCLADVFLALSSKASHVPYRNSKLTMLLQDCLSGEGKSLMFVNVSPTVASTQETICSLRFANQVSQVELGKAQKHIVTTAVVQAPAPAPVAAAHAAAAHTAVMPPPAPTPVAAVSTTPRRSARAPAPNTSIPAPVAANDNSFIDESPAALPRPSTRSSIASSTTTEKSVRFQAANNVIVEEPANNNKPLPVYSFLSSNQPAERIPGTAPKVRMLSSSAARRCSTAATPSTSGAVRLTKGDFSIAATVTSKENEVNAPALSAAPIRASKRDSTLDFSTASKRIKVDDTPSQWNLGSNTGFTTQNSRRTSTWR